jgi:NADH pyrophosphatase NudC (nudix superfamily)
MIKALIKWIKTIWKTRPVKTFCSECGEPMWGMKEEWNVCSNDDKHEFPF